MKKVFNRSLLTAAVLVGLSSTAMADVIGPLERTQDTWVGTNDASLTRNYGGTNNLRIDNGDKMKAYIQFEVTGIPAGHVVESAKLTLIAFKNNAAPIIDTRIHKVTGDWDEMVLTGENDTLVWEETPITTLPDGVELNANDVHEFEVGSAITGNGLITFGIQNLDTTYTNVKYGTKGAGEIPTLTVTTKAAGPVDTTAPTFADSIDPIEINASGLTTNIKDLVQVFATDETDADPIEAEVTSETVLASGSHQVTVEASDTAGNTATTNVTVNITPYVIAVAPQETEIPAGSSADVAVSLSGPAVAYPVNLGYAVSGDAAVADAGTLTFTEENVAQPQTVTVTTSAAASHMQEATLSFTSAENVQASNETVSISATVGNSAPSVAIELSQDGNMVATINKANADAIQYLDGTKGAITVTAVVSDFNQDDLHDISWDGTDSQLNAAGNSFEILTDATNGLINLALSATENNTEDKYQASLATVIKVVATELPELTDLEADSDNDGIPDAEEGYKDTDGDGIVDYLDNSDVVTELPLSAEQSPLKTSDGLKLTVGSFAATAQGVAAQSANMTASQLAQAVSEGSESTTDTNYFPLEGTELINFAVTGATPASAVSVVYPLPESISITDKTEYRKYTPTAGWTEFVESGDNTIKSAAADENGNCPAPMADAYQAGLNAGDNCVQLTIVDGGIYDADGAEDGKVEDPGLFAEKNMAPVSSEATLALEDTIVNQHATIKLTRDLSTLFSDDDGDALVYQVASGSDLFTVDEAGELTANLTEAASGSYSAVITATDIKQQSAQVEVSVNAEYNQAPTLQTPELAQASRNVEYSGSIAQLINEPDGDEYVVSKVSGPHWLQVSETGELSGIPRKADIGTTQVGIEIVDSKGAKISETLSVVVNDSDVRADEAGSTTSWMIAALSLFGLLRRKRK